MQIEKSQPSGQRILPETRLASFPALSVNPRVGISLSAFKADVRFYLSRLSIPYIPSHSVLESLRTMFESLKIDLHYGSYTRMTLFSYSLSVTKMLIPSIHNPLDQIYLRFF